MKILILAGGSGTRLWPLSREKYPKQFIKLLNKKNSLFQETFERSLLLSSIEDIHIITNEKYKFLVMGEIEELGYKYNEKNILIEPTAKNTLPAIYYGVNHIRKEKEDTIVVFPSDHIIQDNNGFCDLIKNSEELAENSIITFGIKPNNPNTGYGYIASGKKYKSGYEVLEFKEKPNQELAEEYVEKGYLWNSGIFLFNSEVFKNEMELYCKEIYDAFISGKDIADVFSKIDVGISIDYGIMEKTDKAVVVPAEFGWNDLGTFDSFYDVFDQDINENIKSSNATIIDAKNNLIYSDNDKAIGIVGVEDLIVIDNKDALLICKKDQSQKVKNLVNILKEKNDYRVDNHLIDYRPWGNYKLLEEESKSYKIKKLTILPGRKISYQMHYHRSEHWMIVSGAAKVVIEDDEMFIGTGESIYINAGQKHKLENPGKIPLEIIEVQMGVYLSEDDIVRFN